VVGSVDDDDDEQVGDIVGAGESSRADDAVAASEGDSPAVREELAAGVRALSEVTLPQADIARMPERRIATAARLERTLTPVQRNCRRGYCETCA
jgi:hypothetical protein